MGRVDGKVALVTGGARGQGAAHAVRLAQEGADILLLDVCERLPGVPYEGAIAADLASTADAVERAGGRGIAHRGDVRDQDESRMVTGTRFAVDAGFSAR